MKFQTSPFTTKLIIGSISCALLGASLLITTTIADNGFINRFERVYSGGIIEISPVPFSDSTYSSSQSTFKNIVTKTSYTSNPLLPLDVLVTITDPQSVGITHVYIPVSTFGSTCGIIQSQIIIHNEEIMTPNIESSVVTTTSSNSSERVRTGNLLPDTLYSYKIISRGCDKTASTYERSFITLPDPSISERKTHKNISPISPYALQTQINNNEQISITLHQPQTIGITHAYIPVSLAGSTCSLIDGYVTAASYNSTEHETKSIKLSIKNKNIIRIGELSPNTTYSYSVTATGCNTTTISYEKEFTTLKDPADVKYPTIYRTQTNSQPRISKAVSVSPEVIPDVVPQENTLMPETLTTQQTPLIGYGEPNSPEEAEPFEEDLTTKVEKVRIISLPKTSREWIALLLLLVGTIGIITSFVHKNKPQA